METASRNAVLHLDICTRSVNLCQALTNMQASLVSEGVHWEEGRGWSATQELENFSGWPSQSIAISWERLSSLQTSQCALNQSRL